MHTGGLGIIGDMAPKNFKHVVFNNGAHDSVGGQPTIGFNVDFTKIARGFGYKKVFEVKKKDNIIEKIRELKNSEGPALSEIKIKKGSSKDLGRPTIAPFAPASSTFCLIQETAPSLNVFKSLSIPNHPIYDIRFPWP